MTSYVLDGADPRTRPVTFAFNGGPGSSSVWLHLGLLGPRRVVMGDVGALEPPPYDLVDNPESLLAVSDLVFIDPMSTGYSRAVEGGKPGDYHGYQRDIESVGELIRLWTSRNKRWMSPKFVAGESYGTLRGAALAEHLQARYGMYLNGLVLISQRSRPVSIDFEKQRNDRAHALYLPTYAAIAHYHGKHGRRSLRSRPRRGRGVCRPRLPVGAVPRRPADDGRARRGGGDAGPALRADGGLRRPRRPAHRALALLHRAAARRAPLRGPSRRAASPGRPRAPSPRTWTPTRRTTRSPGPYAAAWNHYVRDELGYGNDLHYEQISRLVHPWSFKDFEGRPIDVSPQLERAMRQNPHLEVHIAYGYYDGATPHFAAEDVFAHLQLPADRSRQHRARLLRGGPHDVRPRAVARAAEQGPGGIRGEELRPRHVDSMSTMNDAQPGPSETHGPDGIQLSTERRERRWHAGADPADPAADRDGDPPRSPRRAAAHHGAPVPARRHARARQRDDLLRPAGELEIIDTLLDELLIIVSTGQPLNRDAVERSISMLRGQTAERPADVLTMNIVSSRGRTIRPKTLNQKRYVDAIDEHTVVFGIGPAGTGKTYLAMAKAVAALQAKQVNRIILTRPAVEAGERLGFLPGTLNDKIDPYLRPLYDALHDMVSPETIPRLMASGTIEVAPLAYMRGRTLNDAFIILDEAQNTSSEQMKMFLTRLGFGSKMVVTGDITQVDLPGGTRSGLRVVRDILEGVEDVHFAELTSHDVVRHRLVSAIVDAYERDEVRAEAAQPGRGDDRDGEPAAARDPRRGHRRRRTPRRHRRPAREHRRPQRDRRRASTSSSCWPARSTSWSRCGCTRRPTSASSSSTRRPWRCSTCSGWTCPGPPTS